MLKLKTLGDHTCVATLNGHTNSVYALALSADNRWFYSGSFDSIDSGNLTLDFIIKVWRLADYTCVATLNGHTGAVRALALSADNRWLYSGSADATIKVWRLADRTCTMTLTGHTRSVQALALSADNRWLYSGSTDDSIKVWCLADQTCTMTLTGHTNSVWVLALSTDNQWLYSGSGDDTIKVWRIADYTCVATLIDHTDAVTTVVLSADNRWLYSGSYDQTIKIWRLADHTVAATLPCYGTAFVTDSQWLYVGCGRHIQIRPLPMWQLWHETRHYRLSIEQAQRIVTIVLHSDDKLYYDDLRHVIRACTALWLRSP